MLDWLVMLNYIIMLNIGLYSDISCLTCEWKINFVSLANGKYDSEANERVLVMFILLFYEWVYLILFRIHT